MKNFLKVVLLLAALGAVTAFGADKKSKAAAKGSNEFPGIGSSSVDSAEGESDSKSKKSEPEAEPTPTETPKKK